MKKAGKLPNLSGDLSLNDLFAALAWSEQELRDNEALLKRFGYPVPPRAAPEGQRS